MKKQTRRENINNRYTLALAERSIYERGSKQYEQLTEIAHIILRELQTPSGRGKPNRYGFRLRGANYELVTLADSEKI